MGMTAPFLTRVVCRGAAGCYISPGEVDTSQKLDPVAREKLYGIARALLAESDYGELLAKVLDLTIEALGADRGFVLIRDGSRFRAAVARNFKAESLTRAEDSISESIASHVAGEGKALLLEDAHTSPGFHDKKSVKALALRSVLCAPLITSDEAFALIYLENRDVVGSFEPRHMELLDEICSMAAARLRTALEVERARRVQRELGSAAESEGIVTVNERMVAMIQTVRQVAATDLPVLIQGETGTGKELVARALYRNSARANGPYITLNCAAIPDTLISSELFGCVQGAFTGAARDRVGFVAAAHRGTLFLDEIGDMPIELQPQLLRVLQSGEFTRLGSVKTESANVRFIAATNRDLEREVAEGRFRMDLFYRLAAVPITIPPLRERRDDIPVLAVHFLRQFAGRLGKAVPVLSPAALRVLETYSFPGNVRELESEMARLAALTPAGAEISADALTPRFRNASANGAGNQAVAPMSIEEMEKKLIRSVLEHTDGNRTRAAEVLGISREGLRTKMQRFGMKDE